MSDSLFHAKPYEQLLSYQRSMVVYLGTVCFCRRFMNSKDRTVDQMIQAARSGKQNIIEGAMASAASKETEIKLTNVALASLEELKEDYRDYIVTHQSSIWQKDSREAVFVRNLCRGENVNYENTYQQFIETRPANIAANILICVINQATFLLRKQIAAQEKQFLTQGGIREQMTQARLEVRKQQKDFEK